MASSSEEDIINRRQISKSHKRKRDLDELFDEDTMSSDSIEMSNESFEEKSQFNEIFGRGNEYNYVIEESNDHVEKKVAHDKKQIKLCAEDVNAWITKNTSLKNVRNVVLNLASGKNIHYILLHTAEDGFSIEQGYELVDLLEDYSKFLDLRKRMLEEHNEMHRHLLLKMDSLTCLKHFSRYIKHRNGANWPGLLSAEDFAENLRVGEKVYEPEITNLDECPNEAQICNDISLHPIFIDRVEQVLGTLKAVPDEDFLFANEALFQDKIVKFYLSDLPDGNANDYRRQIIFKCIRTAGKRLEPSTNFSENKNLLMQELSDRICNGAIDRVAENEYVAGIYITPKNIRVVVLDLFGTSVAQQTYGTSESLGVLDEYDVKSICITGFTPFVKHYLRNFDKPFLFVDGRIYRNSEPYEIAIGIARLATCPEIEFANLLGENKSINFYNKAHGGDKPYFGLPKNVYVTTVKRAIATSVAVNGIDANYLALHPRGSSLASILDIDVEALREFGHISNLNQLRVVLDNYENAAVYLRIIPSIWNVNVSRDILDALPIHPNNYIVARVICSAACQMQEVQDDKPNKVIQEALCCNKIRGSFEIDKIGETEYGDVVLRCVYNALINFRRRRFNGLPDHLIFECLVGVTKVGITVNARITRCGPNFYIAQAEDDNISAYIPKTDELFLNQMVKIKLESVNYYQLNYTASVIQEEKPCYRKLRFITHPLFRNLGYLDSELYLRHENKRVLLRKSSKGSHASLVLKIDKDLFTHIQVDENESYRCFDKVYDDLDELIDDVGNKVMANVKHVKMHKHYFNTEEEAVENAKKSGTGGYIKYGFVLSRKHPGKVCFIYGLPVHKEYLSIEDTFVQGSQRFSTLNDFIKHKKAQ